MKKITLINSPMQKNFMKSSRIDTYPPMNIVSLATYLKTRIRDLEIKIIDGGLLDHVDDCVTEGDVLGISCNIMTYESALLIAKQAFNKGVKVILGGPYPSSMPERILHSHEYIDSVVVGDGEEALLQYVKGNDYKNIPNLVYRKNGMIIRNKEITIDINNLPILDYSLINLKSYFDEFVERYEGFKPFKKSLPVYSRKGCLWRDLTDGGCIFCMIPHKGLRFKQPETVWREISNYKENYGVNYFWEVCDTFTEDDRWIKEFLRTKPNNLDVFFQIYGRPNHITERMAKQLKELNVYEVFIGAESGDDLILKASNKGINTTQTLRAVETLARNNIDVIVSFVLGLPGETSQTLQKTLSFARELYSFGNIKETSSSIMMPLPGSKSFDMLLNQKGMFDKYKKDLFDLEELKEDWCENFTYLKYDELNEALNEMLAIFPLNDSFDQLGLKSALMC